MPVAGSGAAKGKGAANTFWLYEVTSSRKETHRAATGTSLVPPLLKWCWRKENTEGKSFSFGVTILVSVESPGSDSAAVCLKLRGTAQETGWS